MNDRARLEAELRGVELALDELKSEYRKGVIGSGRYLRLLAEFETSKTELKQKLKNLVGDSTPALPLQEQSDSLGGRFKWWIPVAVIGFIGLAAVLLIVFLKFTNVGDDPKPTSSPTSAFTITPSVVPPATDAPSLTVTPTATNTPMSAPTASPMLTPTPTTPRPTLAPTPITPSPTSTPTLTPTLSPLVTS